MNDYSIYEDAIEYYSQIVRKAFSYLTREQVESCDLGHEDFEPGRILYKTLLLSDIREIYRSGEGKEKLEYLMSELCRIGFVLHSVIKDEEGNICSGCVDMDKKTGVI